ncbi:sensor histidine kinase [Paenibacillus sp. GCM10027626]|uniref:sensor histidine kinase n=1 Tax=Paenibacillus sp. GCM10027626 TaxID=3273411 RepID=UPI00363C7E31
MIRSLYVRFVLVFLGAVTAGLVVAFIVTSISFSDKLSEQLREDAVAMGEELIAIYKETAKDGSRAFENNVRAIKHYSVRVFSEAGEVAAISAIAGENMADIPADKLQALLSGEGSDRVYIDRVVDAMVGLPFEYDGQRYAMFLQMMTEEASMTLNQILGLFLLIVLVTGSLIFVIAVRYVTKPVRQMTAATKRFAKGDFSIELDIKHKDELGGLAQSFNYMAREMQQVEQMRQDFVSNVSHEIQSPLTSISGFAKALKNGVASEEHRQRYLDIIMNESERLSRLGDNLLKLASLESEHHPFHPTTYRLDEQIRNVVVSCEPLWSAKQIGIDLEQLPVVKINADKDQLNQVWLNLLGNSIKFTPEGGEIRIWMKMNLDEIIVCFADTGLGIAPDRIGHIFERFYKVDRARNRKQSGSGLGLAIVKKIVDLHRGTIEVSSEPGKGTAVKVMLPGHAAWQAAAERSKQG